MAKKIEFQIPVHDCRDKPYRRGAKPTGFETRTGTVALLTLGEGPRLRCVIHDDILTEYRSGQRIGTLQGVKIERMARLSTYHRTSDREAAQITLNRIVAKLGEGKVRAVIDGAPTVNA